MRANSGTTWVEKRGILLVLAITVGLLGLFLYRQWQITDAQLGVPLDDAWIHYQFARNISQGNGFSYNPNQPTPGSTAPLWTLILAGVGLFSDSYVLASLMLSALFLLLTIGGTYTVVYALKFPKPVALLAALGTALSGRMLWAGLSGMEVTLFAFLTLVTIYLYQKDGLSIPTAIVAGLSSQVRPEAHLLFVILASDTLIKNIKIKNTTLTATLSSLFSLLSSLFSLLFLPTLVYFLINLPYMAFSLSVTGRPLPNTFYAKSDSSELFSSRTLLELFRIHFRDNVFLFIMVPFGLNTLWKSSRIMLLWLLGLFFITPFVVPFIWHHGRYTMPLIPFMMATGAIGCWWIWQRKGRLSGPAAAGVIFMLVVLSGAARVPFWANMLGQNVLEIIEIDISMATWLSENTPTDAVIAVDDIGAIGFLSEREIFDLNGLISPEVWPVINGTEPGISRDAAMVRVLANVDPDYLAIFPEWHWNIATNSQIGQEMASFQTDTQTIIGGKQSIVYQINEWPFLETANPQYPTQFIIGDQIALTGYDLVVVEDLQVNLYWRKLAQVDQSYHVFIHLYDENGEIVTQADMKPVAGLLPTNEWQTNDFIKDQYTLKLPAFLPPGTYDLAVGFYYQPTGERLPVTGNGEIFSNAAVIASPIIE